MRTSGGLFPAGWDLGRDLFVVVGRGADDLLRRLLEHGQRRLVVVVPEEAGRGGAPRRVTVAHTPLDVLDAVLSLQGPLPTRVLVRRQGDPWVTDELHRELARTVEDALRAKRSLAEAAGTPGARRLANALANLPRLARAPSIAPLHRAYPRRPCVVIAAGPSLERNVGLLAALKGKALLVATRDALAPLGRAGVAPDLVVATGAEELAPGLEDAVVRAPEALAAAATCAPSTLALPFRRAFSFTSHGPLDEWIEEALGERARLRTCGAVACSALSLALHLGCDPIALVGLDLALAAAGARAAGGAGHPRSGDRVGHGSAPSAPSGEAAEMPGRGGGRVRTSAALQAHLLWFETLARSLAGERQLVDCTEGGAHVRGMERRPLPELVEGFCRRTLDVAAPLDAAAAGLDVGGRRARAAARVREAEAALARCLALARRCDHLAQEAEGRRPRLEALHAAQGELSRALRAVRFVSLVAQDEIAAATAAAEGARTLAENLAAARRLFDAVARAAEGLAAPLERARAGLEEESP